MYVQTTAKVGKNCQNKGAMRWCAVGETAREHSLGGGRTGRVLGQKCHVNGWSMTRKQEDGREGAVGKWGRRGAHRGTHDGQANAADSECEAQAGCWMRQVRAAR